MPNSILSRSLIAHTCLIVGLCSTSLAETGTAPTKAKLKLATFTQFLKNDAHISYTDITSRTKGLIANPKRFLSKKHSYNSLKLYYERALRGVGGNFKQRPFSIKVDAGLQAFSGDLELSSGLVHLLPFIPISPESFRTDKIVIKTIKVNYPLKKIYGIRLETSADIDIPEKFLAMTNRYSYDLSYMATVNAKVMGFTHAQLVPQLSRNVIPAEKFEYNGQRDWSQHSRYARMDQVKGPIRLTNWTHAAGSLYAISSHPDFSTTLKSPPSQDAVLTFYLWKDESLLSRVSGGPIGQLPDFISQVVFKAKIKK